MDQNAIIACGFAILGRKIEAACEPKCEIMFKLTLQSETIEHVGIVGIGEVHRVWEVPV